MTDLTWKPIETAPRDGTDIIVGFDCATVWIVRSAWWDDDEHDERGGAGWWSYRHSVTQEKLCDHWAPTHWLCEVPEHQN